MGVDAEVGVSSGDVMRRLRNLEKLVERLQADRRLESASIGAGGVRIQGGRVLAEDSGGERIFEVTTEPPGIFMRQELITELAVQIFADRISSDTVTTFETTTSTAFIDLATVGPTVSNVEITNTGRALVFLSAFISATGDDSGRMGVEISGASGLSPTAARSLIVGNLLVGHTNRVDPTMAPTKTLLITGLFPGAHTFQAKYNSKDGSTIGFSDRNITVIAF